MQFEWDDAKAASNVRKHGVDFADAVAVLRDLSAITYLDDYLNEERYISIGMDALGRILVVVYTWRSDDVMRLISARRATRSERASYER